MTLPDTSIWIHYFRYKSGAPSDYLEVLLTEEKAVYNGIVLGELLQGAKSRHEYNRIKNHLTILPFLEFDYATWVKGSEIAYNLRRKGITIPLTDCMIAAQCLQTGSELFTTDIHFDTIAEEFPLILVKV